MFVTLCVLWTVWSSHSNEELSWLARSATRVTPGSVALILTGLVGLGLAAVAFGHSSAEWSVGASKLVRKTAPEPTFSWAKALATGLACCGLLLVIVLPAACSLDGTIVGELHAAISQEQLNQMDADAQRRGYYEELDVTRRDENLLFLRSAAPRGWDSGVDQFERKTNDILITDLVPGGPVLFHGKPVTVNRWQMRDRDYEKARPSGVYRIAVVGSSVEFGSGVGDNETYENLLEDQLNSQSPINGGDRYEILNFALPGHSALQYLALLERRVFDFDPQAVWLVVSAADLKRSVEHAATVLQSSYAIPYDILRNVARQAGIEPGMSLALMRARLKPYGPDLVAWAFQRIVDQCRERHIAVYMVYRPPVIAWSKRMEAEETSGKRQLITLAEDVHMPVLDLSAAFDGIKNRRNLMVAAWDEHANAMGHKLLGEELYKRLHNREGAVILHPRKVTAPP